MIKQYSMRIFCLLLVLTIFFLLSSCQNQPDSIPPETITSTLPAKPAIEAPNKHEYLVIWGRETWPDGDCILWIVNPDSEELTRTVMETSWCNIAVSNVSGSQKLISFPPYFPQASAEVMSSEIRIYQIDGNGSLQHIQTIPLEGLHLTGTPQWSPNNLIYFSAIENGEESIYRYDENTQTASRYITAETGFATSPIISPDGRYIAYQVWEDHNSRDDCGQQTCFSRFLHVWDVESNTDISLAPLIEPFIAGESYYSHCEPEWSQTDSLLAFDVGCGVQTPSSIVVFDPGKNDMPIAINPTGSTASIIKFHWAEGNRLILNGTAQISGHDVIENGYLIYSASTNRLEQMIGLPERNIYDNDLIYFNDWTNDAKFAVGQTQVPGDSRTVNIVIAGSWEKSDNGIYIQTPDGFIDDVQWSPTNRNIAYRSYGWETKESESRFMIIDATGSLVFDSGMLQVVSPKFQWYVQP